MPYHSTGSVCRLLCAKDKHSLHRFPIRMGSQNSQNGLPKCVFSVSWQTGHEHVCCYEESGAFKIVCNAFQQAFRRHNNASWKSAYLGATLLRHSITISPIRPFLLVFNCSLSMAAVHTWQATEIQPWIAIAFVRLGVALCLDVPVAIAFEWRRRVPLHPVISLAHSLLYEFCTTHQDWPFCVMKNSY